jgi:hypothetical protein
VAISRLNAAEVEQFQREHHARKCLALGGDMQRPLSLSATHHPEDNPEAAHEPAAGASLISYYDTPML